jgi:glyoxalase family protein
VLPLVDPHGLAVALVEPLAARHRDARPWKNSTVPVERQVRGLYGARLWERAANVTTIFLTDVLGFRRLAEEGGWSRYGFETDAGVVDIRETPDQPRGAWGVGCVHHLAWRVKDERHQLAMRERVVDAGGRATEVIDRFWFQSVYFKEPGGVLFELATDGPGFAVDEEPGRLGETLVLPPWLEARRPSIEHALPPLLLPRDSPGGQARPISNSD